MTLSTPVSSGAKNSAETLMIWYQIFENPVILISKSTHIPLVMETSSCRCPAAFCNISLQRLSLDHLSDTAPTFSEFDGSSHRRLGSYVRNQMYVTCEPNMMVWASLLNRWYQDEISLLLLPSLCFDNDTFFVATKNQENSLNALVLHTEPPILFIQIHL